MITAVRMTYSLGKTSGICYEYNVSNMWVGCMIIKLGILHRNFAYPVFVGD